MAKDMPSAAAAPTSRQMVQAPMGLRSAMKRYAEGGVPQGMTLPPPDDPRRREETRPPEMETRRPPEEPRYEEPRPDLGLERMPPDIYPVPRMGGITLDDGTFIPGADNGQGGVDIGGPAFFAKYANNPTTMARLREMYGFTGDQPEYPQPQIGYMPEERGLYKKMKIGEQALYLAQLRGLSKADAMEKIKYWFEKFEMQSWWNKKVEDLSKGMSQKLQFVITVLHEPKLIILDEPFSGLDPLNANLIKDEIYNLAKKGSTIIFSTHRMEQVEEICDHIVLVNLGKKVLDGSVAEIKQQFKEYICYNKDFCNKENLKKN
jgi:ABC-type Na+ transport system ATPase subunit NatA